MRLAGLVIADEPSLWATLGFAVAGDRLGLGGVTIELAGRGAGEGILGWSVPGLASTVLPDRPVAPSEPVAHPNGATAVDHVVALAGDLDATMASLEREGLRPRRVREVPDGRRQAFYVLKTALLELVGPAEGVEGARFWGLTLVTEDLDALAALLGERLGAVREAVQPGRRIATLSRSAGSSVPLAFMTPR